MQEIRGISASPGIAIGKVFLYHDEELDIPEYSLENKDKIPSEMERFRDAVAKSVADLQAIQESPSSSHKDSGFIEAHIMMLQDQELEAKIAQRLEASLKNIEYVVNSVSNEFFARLSSIDDEYLKERALDIRDVYQRLLAHLLEKSKVRLDALKEEIILVTPNLMPSDAVSMSKRLVKGIVMDSGGRTSHTAIVARSFDIPAVLGTTTISKKARNGQMIIVDGLEGVAILDPNQEVLKTYRQRQRDFQREESELLGLNELKAETRDGKTIFLKANIEVPEEVEGVLAHNADGVGLYRSEFLFMQDGVNALEEDQFRAYKSVLEGMGDKPVTIRTMDLGGDKLSPELIGSGEANPILGWRAIRYCLDNRDVFKRQLRALLRASVYGQLRIMFPMISGIDELEIALSMVAEAKEELRAEEIPFREEIPIGTMIEVPSAALSSDLLARRADFFSIGTNDLIQYTIAVDRGNEKIAYLYEPYHPGVLRLIQTVIENAHNKGIPVGMCGEMASDPNAALILLGLGLDEFSMSPSAIPKVKKIIRSCSFSEAEEVVGRVLDMRTSRDIEEFIRTYLKGRLFDEQTTTV
jgi:phosphotransferase system enzyme I (PtsI)